MDMWKTHLRKIVSKFAFLEKSWYDISVLVTFTPFLFTLWMPQSTHYRWFLEMRSLNVLSQYIASLTSVEVKLQSSNISSESQTISEISDSRSNKSKISPHYRGFFMEKIPLENIENLLTFSEIIIYWFCGQDQSVGKYLDDSKIVRSFARRLTTLRWERYNPSISATIGRPYLLIMSKKTHGQKVRRKIGLSRRKRETWSVLSWNMKAHEFSASSWPHHFTFLFSLLAFFTLTSFIHTLITCHPLTIKQTSSAISQPIRRSEKLQTAER